MFPRMWTLLAGNGQGARVVDTELSALREELSEFTEPHTSFLKVGLAVITSAIAATTLRVLTLIIFGLDLVATICGTLQLRADFVKIGIPLNMHKAAALQMSRNRHPDIGRELGNLAAILQEQWVDVKVHRKDLDSLGNETLKQNLMRQIFEELDDSTDNEYQ